MIDNRKIKNNEKREDFLSKIKSDNSLLHLAILHTKTPLIKILIDLKVNVNSENSEKQVPFTLCALRPKGAWPNSEDKLEILLLLAEKTNFDAIAKSEVSVLLQELQEYTNKHTEHILAMKKISTWCLSV